MANGLNRPVQARTPNVFGGLPIQQIRPELPQGVRDIFATRQATPNIFGGAAAIINNVIQLRRKAEREEMSDRLSEKQAQLAERKLDIELDKLGESKRRFDVEQDLQTRRNRTLGQLFGNKSMSDDEKLDIALSEGVISPREALQFKQLQSFETPEQKEQRKLEGKKQQIQLKQSQLKKQLADQAKIIESDLNDVLSTFSKIPSKLRGPVQGRTSGLFAEFFQTKGGGESLAEYNDTVEFILSNISRQLGGERGVLTDRDIQRIRQALPERRDTDTVAQNKIDRIKRFINRRMDDFEVSSKDINEINEESNLSNDNLDEEINRLQEELLNG